MLEKGFGWENYSGFVFECDHKYGHMLPHIWRLHVA